MPRPALAPPRPVGVGPIRRRGLLTAGLAVAVLLTGGVTGCRNDVATPTEDRVELSVFWWGGDKRAELTQQALQLYSARHPKVTFRFTWQGNAGYYDRLATQAVGGNPPDLFQIDDNYLTEYAQRKILLDLTEFVARGRLDLGGLPRSLVQYGQVGGQTVAVANSENTPGLIFNRGLLRRLGLPDPYIGMSYDEFLNWAAAVKNRGGGTVAGTADPSADYKALWLWLRGQGKELYRGRQVGFTVDDLTRWFDLWKGARARGLTPPLAETQKANSGDLAGQPISTGTAATSFVWSNQLSELQKGSKDELGVIAYPGPPAAHWARASQYWAGFRGTRHAELVVDIINFLTNDVEAGRILGTERGLSANLGVRRVVQESLTDESMKDSLAYEAAMTGHFGPAPAPPPKGHVKVRALLVTAAEGVQFGRLASWAAAAQFVAQANAALTA